MHLWVADESITPTIPSAGTNLTTIIIAARIADQLGTRMTLRTRARPCAPGVGTFANNDLDLDERQHRPEHNSTTLNPTLVSSTAARGRSGATSPRSNTTARST